VKYNEFVRKLNNEIPFAFSRWGDGEWLNVNGVNGKNCDGNVYYPDLGQKLKSIVSTKQNYYLGCQTGNDISVKSSKIYYQEWFDADILHKASINGNLNHLFDVLENVHVVYIGNKSHRNLPFINEFIEIPYNNIWNDRDWLIDSIKETFTQSHKVYCFSAGMATNVFIDILWKVDDSNTYIDVGSVFDPYVGRQTRGYHKNLKVKVNRI